jgi:hypothetical protein
MSIRNWILGPEDAMTWLGRDIARITVPSVLLGWLCALVFDVHVLPINPLIFEITDAQSISRDYVSSFIFFANAFALVAFLALRFRDYCRPPDIAGLMASRTRSGRPVSLAGMTVASILPGPLLLLVTARTGFDHFVLGDLPTALLKAQFGVFPYLALIIMCKAVAAQFCTLLVWLYVYRFIISKRSQQPT